MPLKILRSVAHLLGLSAAIGASGGAHIMDLQQRVANARSIPAQPPIPMVVHDSRARGACTGRPAEEWLFYVKSIRRVSRRREIRGKILFNALDVQLNSSCAIPDFLNRDSDQLVELLVGKITVCGANTDA